MEKRRLNATAASLLGFLHRGPLTGWDLVQTAQLLIGDFWSLTPSQVYRELSAMAEAGYVEAGERGPRDRRPYTITEAGRAAFAESMRAMPGPETIRFPLLLVIAFGQRVPPPRLAQIVRQHRRMHAEKLARYLTDAEALDAAEHPDVYASATFRFGIVYERAVLDWFDTLPEEIRGPGPWPPRDDDLTDAADDLLLTTPQ